MKKIFMLLFFSLLLSQSLVAQKKKVVDSLSVIVKMVVKDDKIETAKNFWPSYYQLPIKMHMYGFHHGNPKHLYRTFELVYDDDIDAWRTTVPWGFFELEMTTMNFKNILFPMRLKENFEEEFTLEVDSLLYTYKDAKPYYYIEGTLNFNETIIVDFKSGDYATNRAFLDEALDVEGLEYINVRRAYKMRGRNAFVVTLDIWDIRSLNTIVRQKVTRHKYRERGYIIGNSITKAIELYQANPNVIYANPSFLETNEEVVFRKSEDYPKSEKLEYKLLKMMEEDEITLQKINYIIEQTTIEEVVEETEEE